MKSQLYINMHGQDVHVRYRSKEVRVSLDKQSLLWGIEKIVGNPRKISDIQVRIGEATFSTTRQIIAAVNTLAWALRIKVNGKRQIKATYSREPNITMPKS